jgi:hypothetical protein
MQGDKWTRVGEGMSLDPGIHAICLSLSCVL